MAKEKRTETAYERHWDEFWNGYDDSRYNQTSPEVEYSLDEIYAMMGGDIETPEDREYEEMRNPRLRDDERI